MRWLLSFPVVLGVLRSGAADACDITGPAPTGVIPTVPSQPFSFVATTDCTMLSFSAQRGDIVKTPRAGRMMGADRRRYTVSLTLAEWNTVASSDAATFVWVVTGQTGMTRTRSTTTNELDFDADGWTRSEGDLACDLDDTRNPGRVDVMGNGVDDDCDGRIDNTRFDDPTADIRSRLPTPQLGLLPFGVADLDADGTADLAMGTSTGPGNRGTVYVVYGPMSGAIRADASTVLTTRSEYIGLGIGAGDADADGIADLATGSEVGDAAYLLLGPVTADRRVNTSEAVFEGPGGSSTGADVDIVPDFDGDGTGDVVIGARSSGSLSGMVYVASGGSTGTIALDTSATYAFHGVGSGTQLGRYDFPIGDVSGDGISDLALTALDTIVYLVEGGQPAGNYDVDVAAWASLAPGRGALGQGGLSSGDYDGDGTLDLIAGDPSWTDEDASFSSGAAYAFIGPFAGPISTGDATATWTGSTANGLAGLAVSAADVDADGSLDVLVGAPGVQAGAVYLQLGFASGVMEMESLPYFSVAGASSLGQQVATLPDWDGDGGVEIAMGAPSTNALAGAVFVFESDPLFP